MRVRNRQLSILILLSVLFMYGCSDDKKPESQSIQPAAPHYSLARAEKRNVQQIMKLPAQLAAFEEVSIFPKVNGYVKTVAVDIGSHVRRGQELMLLEAPELNQAVVQAKEKYGRAVADYMISKDNDERLQQASRTPGAISPMDLASAGGRREADSALSNSEKANWQMQETMLSYLRVTAPFDGIITQLNVHPGALVSAENKDRPMLELKEVDHLRLQVDLPENIAAMLKNNDTISFYLSAFPGKKMLARISRKSMNVNAQFRSERVEADVPNKDELLAPGMYADIQFDSKGNPDALSVPKSAVVTSTERKYVIVVRNGKTIRVNVSTGNEDNHYIQVVGDLRAGEEVIANASDEIKEGE